MFLRGTKFPLFCGMVAAVLFQTWFFCRTIGDPWTDNADFNGAVWSQAAHNFLKAGFIDTVGVPAPFYFGPLPIPGEEYYCHHSGMLALTVSVMFYLFGEHEWAARLVPIACSSVSVVLLWFIVAGCAGRAVATLSVVAFVSLPMELRWGQMVNFEPCTLMWMLVGFLGLRSWECTGKARWKILLLAGFSLSILTSWVGCLLVLMLCIHFLAFERKSHGLLALWLIAFTACFGALFLLQISLVRPDALRDLAYSFSFRLSHTVSARDFTFLDWAGRMQRSWGAHFPIAFVLSACVGGAYLLRNKARAEGLRWLGWFCASIFAMNTLYVFVFRNASYIHDYASFYFTVPIATLAAVGIHAFGGWIGKAFPQYERLPEGISSGLIVALAMCGYWKALALTSQAHILSLNQPEPKNLIPALGRTIELEFSPETEVLSNIDLYFTPQFWYYSRRKLVNGFTQGAYWRDYISSQPRERLGGVIWLGAPESQAILAVLSSKSQMKTVLVDGIPFCIWKPF